MSGSIEHHATVDKGLKMKIKRKNVNLDKSDKQKKDSNKSENTKTESKGQGESGHNSNGMLAADKGASKLSLFTDKEKSPKSKNTVNKKDKGKALAKGDSGSCGAGSSVNGMDNLFSQNTMEPKLGETASGKKECMPDPYEFNAKVEDGFSVPMKKMKIEKEKGDGASSSSNMTHLTPIGSPQDVSTDTCDMGVVTEPECLGPCEPGTHVNLEGIVWHESDNGVLVVNITWRGKTYVGTLLDATRHDWAPPRLNCDSPTSEFESRTPKGRGKRRGASNTPVNDTRTLRKGRRGSQQTFTAPPSPAKSDISVGGVKRKGRPQDIDLSSMSDHRGSKRSRSGSQVPTPNSDTPPTDSQGYIECPEPNCNKKYRHANGLKYHQSHAHSGGSNPSVSTDDSRDMDTEDLPLSAMKNAVKKEKESKKESNKKDINKDSGSPNSDKSSKLDAKVDKSDKDTKDSESEGKDLSSKSDAKCDNGNSSKKRESSAKQTVSNNGKSSSISQNSSSKSSAPSSATSSPSSQSNSASNSVIPASQSASVTSGTSSLSTFSNSSNSGLPAATASSSNTVTNSPSALASEAASKADNKLVDIKPKLPSEVRAAKSNRPIVPAPTPQVLGNVQVTHSNLSPVMSHTQMSPRPIQPKPTIMGETQNINPALADLNKDRKKVQKKKNLKEGAVQAGLRNDQPTVKIERTGVIKTNPLPHKQLDQSNKKDNSAKDGQRPPTGSDQQRSQTQGSHSKALDMSHSRVNNNNSNMLKVGSPLAVTTPDSHKSQMNEDVQSPAYSDISDANESASPAGPSDVSPQKHKEDTVSGKKDEPNIKSEPMTSPTQQQLPPAEGSQMLQHYGMPPYYYGQPPYGMNMSPSQKSGNAQSGGSGNMPGGTPNSLNNQKENLKASSNEEKKSSGSEDMSKGDNKKLDDKDRDIQNRPKGMPQQPGHPPGAPGGMPSNMSPQQMSDYNKMQQNWYHQQMYIQSLPQQLQYQYMANGWYPPVDPGYMQQVMEDHRRGEPGRQEREGANPGGPGSGPEPGRDRGGPEMKGQQGSGGSMPRKDDSKCGAPKPLPSPGQSALMDRSDSGRNSSDEKIMKDQALRDKQNENHQILKENINLTYEMDKNREYQERMRMQSVEERERRRMYQEQKMIEERKKMEMSARKGEGRGAEGVTSKPPGTKPVVEHSPRNMLPGQSRSMEDAHRDIKQEAFDRKDGRSESYSRDSSAGKYTDSNSKCSDDKSRTPVSDKHRPDSAYRNPDTPKHRPGGTSSKSGSPSTSLSSSVPGSPSYSPYLNTYPYNQKFMGIDPMYRNQHVNPIMGGYPGYIHPSQMGYRPGPGEEKDKSAQKPVPSPSPGSDSELKKSGDMAGRGGPYYGSMHKIHELSEKARPRSRNSSPGPVTSSASYDKHRDYTNSPPTQRHVHTHHHTHVLQPGPGLPPAPGLSAPLYDPYGAGKY